MRAIYYIILTMAITLIIPGPSVIAQEEDLKTDLKIITTLDSGSFLTPALSENGTFVYDNFEFNLYSNTNNTGYTIIVNNVTIANRTIDHFMDVFTWKCKESYINKLEVFIGSYHYEYSNIFVFTYEVTNRSVLRDDELITFTPEELARYIFEREAKVAIAVMVGVALAFTIGFILMWKHKQKEIKRIA